MRVLVTGGTGYVGSHTVAALVEAGHEVRLLVRARERVAPAVAPLGLRPSDLDTIVGDVTDPAAVEEAVRGCEAVVHAGSAFSLESRDARRIRQLNVRGTDLVLGAAHRAGLDPIVYVSSIVALRGLDRRHPHPNRAGRGPARHPGDAGRLGPMAVRPGPHLPPASRPAHHRMTVLTGFVCDDG
jgi:dihydroflavonol-4-reductase